MGFVRNQIRLNSDKRFYSQTDSYDLPGRLRAVRDKHCYGLPRSVSFFEESEPDFKYRKHFRAMDEDEAYAKWMNTFWGSLALAGLRTITCLRELIFRIAPPPVRVSSWGSLNSSEVDVELGKLPSREGLLARAAETVSQTDILNSNISTEEIMESIVINKDNSDGKLCDGVFRKFKLNIGSEESVQCVEVSLMHEKSFFDNLLAEKHDVKSIVLSEKCACVVWIWSEHTRIVVITESSNPNAWSLQQWYKKVLADMALMDSRLIGHPYYWHPMVRRRLNRVVKRFKKLYRKIAELEAIKKGLPLSTVTLFDNSLSKGNRRRGHSQSFIEEVDEDSEDEQLNDEFLMKNFVPGWERGHHDSKSCNSSKDRYFCNSDQIGDCGNKGVEYHMNILDSDSDSSSFSGVEDNMDYPPDRKSKTQTSRKYRNKNFPGKYCEDDINHSETMLNSVYQNSEISTNREDRVYNRRMSSETLESHENGKSKSKNKKRRSRRQIKGDHCVVPIENNSSDSQEVVI